MEVGSSNNYSDFHRKFLRTITGKGMLEVEDAQRHLEDIKEAFPDHNNLTLATTIQQINNALKIFDQQLSMVKHEQFEKEFVVLSTIAPLNENLVTQQKIMRPNDFKYFEAVLRAVLDSEGYKLRYKIALTTEVRGPITSGRRSLGGDNKSLLKLWIKLGYFSFTDGLVYLGPKSLVELKGYIHSEYPDISSCSLCMNVTFLHHSCGRCGKSFHQTCLNKFWEAAPNSCPSCRNNWDG